MLAADLGAIATEAFWDLLSILRPEVQLCVNFHKEKQGFSFIALAFRFQPWRTEGVELLAANS